VTWDLMTGSITEMDRLYEYELNRRMDEYYEMEVEDEESETTDRR